ncbi:hypothetical protein LTR94_030436, partial [Friedmanniomyces endolithicus]
MLVKSVEVVTGGASSAYGSDAVAGVVNFVLDKKYKGLKVQIDNGVTDKGDGYNYSMAVAAAARAGGFDLAAVDHYMPGIDGLETMAQLMQLPSPPAIVYVTGSEETRVAVAALRAGAADYVVKTPGEDFFDLLDASFRQVLARAELHAEKSQAEAALRASNARLEALLAEVNHRVANSLQLVSAMIGLQKGVMTDERAREALEDTQRRIRAIAQ